MITKYHSYNNAELLQLMEDKRDKSPIIEELCLRIEHVGLECPICEADLTVKEE